MTTPYKLNAKELSETVIKSIKEAFKGKDIEITVTDNIEETEYLLSTEANKSHLYQALEDIDQGKSILMTLAELKEKYLK